MYYRGPEVLAVVWLGSPPPCLAAGGGGWGEGRSQINGGEKPGPLGCIKYSLECTVAEQRASYLFGKSPKMCGRKIYVICLVQLFRQSCFKRSC